MSPCTLKMGRIARCPAASASSRRGSANRGDDRTRAPARKERDSGGDRTTYSTPSRSEFRAWSEPNDVAIDVFVSRLSSSSSLVACGIGIGKGRGYSRGGFGQHETCQQPAPGGWRESKSSEGDARVPIATSGDGRPAVDSASVGVSTSVSVTARE